MKPLPVPVRKKLPVALLRVRADVVVARVSVNEPDGVLVMTRDELPVLLTVPEKVVVQSTAP